MEPEVSILLATYNSEKFLKEQIDSILNQTYTNWKLIIQDGGSTDGTLKLINTYANNFPLKIQIISNSKRLSACQNFSKLITHAQSDYIMFSDHDDIWLNFKIEVSLKKILEIEQEIDIPLCVFTDLKVVDENLNILSESMFKYANLHPKRTELSYQLVQNVPTGCTMLINKPLINLVKNIPDTAVMHDHWISLVATCFGKLFFLQQQTVFYRQHSSNYYGVTSYGIKYYFIKCRQGINKAVNRFHQNVIQAKSFKEHFSHKLINHQLIVLDHFSKINSYFYLKKLYIIIKYSIYKNGIFRNIGMFILLYFKNDYKN